MSQCDSPRYRFLTYPVLGGGSHAIYRQTPEIETHRKGEYMIAGPVAFGLGSRRAGEAGRDSAALLYGSLLAGVGLWNGEVLGPLHDHHRLWKDSQDPAAQDRREDQ